MEDEMKVSDHLYLLLKSSNILKVMFPHASAFHNKEKIKMFKKHWKNQFILFLNKISGSRRQKNPVNCTL